MDAEVEAEADTEVREDDTVVVDATLLSRFVVVAAMSSFTSLSSSMSAYFRFEVLLRTSGASVSNTSNAGGSGSIPERTPKLANAS